jgi:hypothetical protein
MKLIVKVALTVALLSSILFSIFIIIPSLNVENETLFFGVTCGSAKVTEQKLLVDKVKTYTNLFVVNNWDIATNETALNDVCEYVINSGLNLMVYFNSINYEWHIRWLNEAKEKWGTRFLGVYSFDEPGGRRIDGGGWVRGEAFENVSDYSEAAKKFVDDLYNDPSPVRLRNNNILMFTADYTLYWFDYMAGYNAVFAEFGWNNSRIQQIALCRGAAKVQNKDWGAIVTWTYGEPPYLARGPEIFDDMLVAYHAGAKYILVFNHYPTNQTYPYGTLKDEHFTAMKNFWDVTRSSKGQANKLESNVAFVLPDAYGWGMRNPHDRIWGIWPSDDLSPLLWEKMNKLIEKHELELDIIYDNTQFNYENKYVQIYRWDEKID